MNKLNACDKHKKLVSILKEEFKETINLSRLKFISLFIVALCKVQTVGFEKLANAFERQAKASSSLRRIQRFISGFVLNTGLISKLIFSLLPEKGNLQLTIDRTNWKFGRTNINIFMLGIVYKGIAFPLLFRMLDKRGNSNSKERINLVERFIRLFWKNCIDCLLTDREFIEKKWIEYLNNQGLRYYIRIRKNFNVYLPRKSKEIKVWWLFNSLKKNDFFHYPHIVKIHGEYCYLSGNKTLNKNGQVDYLIIISFNKPRQAQINYKQRWQIESCFKAMRSSGFDIEKTHLQDIRRIEKLLLLIMIAFVWYIANVLLNPLKNNQINIFKFLSCT